jgi:NAD(P)-dependent dehydrogenase (short-subunit alcohol dehydrogenase family)
MTDTTSTDVDCIAMYGITTGVTATTYEPSSNVPRWQMALYLTRMASKAGHTLGSGADQGFTDISGYSAAIQTAINQIKQLTVTTGTTATTYSPDDNVTREQMAMFIERLLGLTTPGPGGSILLTASTAGITGYPMRSPYAASKYAVVGLGQTLAMEVGELGIRVNVICPGSVDGERMDGVIAAESAATGVPEANLRAGYEKQVSMRTFVEGRDIGAMAVFLASPAARFVNGQTISVDGGLETLRTTWRT